MERARSGHSRTVSESTFALASAEVVLPDASEQLNPALNPEGAFDRIARLTRRHLDVSVCTVSLLADDGLHLIGCLGMPEPYQTTRRINSTDTLTARVVADGKPIIVGDSSEHPEFSKIVREYCAAEGALAIIPIRVAPETAIGALVALDPRPRDWSDEEIEVLYDFASACADQLRAEGGSNSLQQPAGKEKTYYQRSRMVLELSKAFASARSVQDIEEAVRDLASRGMDGATGYLALANRDNRSVTFVSEVPDVSPQAYGFGGARPPARALITDNLPTLEAVRTGTTLYFQSGDALCAHYPTLEGYLQHNGAAVFLPILVDAKVEAVICMRWTHPRAPNPITAALATTLIPFVGHALDRVSQLAARHEVATTLQAALLTDPPEVPGLEIATTYEPATRTDQVGGDWYDVVRVDERTTMVMIGDVVGHDIRSAARMGQLRSMLRALAWSHTVAPSSLLKLLDQANYDLGPKAEATAIVARLDREYNGSYKVTWSNAGHPHPLILRRDGRVEVRAESTDLLLGVIPTVDRIDRTTTLAPGEMLLLYTDGLVESPGNTLSERISLLAHTLDLFSGVATALLPMALVRALVATPQRDDVAVLAVRVAPEPIEVTRELSADIGELAQTRKWLESALREAGVAPELVRAARLLSSELITNALVHGAAPITTTARVSEQGTVWIGVFDSGVDRPEIKSPEPTALSGRGVMFLDKLAHAWGVDDADDGPGKTVWFELKPGGQPIMPGLN